MEAHAHPLVWGPGAVLGAAAGVAADVIAQLPSKVAKIESLMPKTQVLSSYSRAVKATPPSLFTDRGSGTDFETRLSSLDGYLTPNDRFYLRSHGPTPQIDVQSWRLKVSGSGVRSSIALTYDEIASMPQITLTRTIECAGNGRRFYKEHFGVEGEGSVAHRRDWMRGMQVGRRSRSVSCKLATL